MNRLDTVLHFVDVPIVAFSSLVEAAVLSRRAAYDWRAAGVSLTDLLLRVDIQIFLALSIATPVVQWAYQHRLATIGLDGWGSVMVLFVRQEFCYYW